MSFEFFKHLAESKIHSHKIFQEMDLSIEIPAGGKRTGVSKAGEAWEMPIDDHYGYIKGTHSPDGEHLDCYLRKNPDKDAKVYVMHQLTVDGSKFDEDKVMLGYSSAAEARKAFKKYTFKPDVMFGGMTEFDLDHFLIAAYQASKSKAMLTDRATYSDFVKRGLMPAGVHSPLTVARRVSESLSEGLTDLAKEMNDEWLDEDIGSSDLPGDVSDINLHMADATDTDPREDRIMAENFVVVVQTQIMENIGTADLPQWATAGTKTHLIQEGLDAGEARAVCAKVAAGLIPVELSEREYVLGIDAIPVEEYRQFYEAVEADEVVEEINELAEMAKLAGIKETVQETDEPKSVRDWAARLEALQARCNPADLQELAFSTEPKSSRYSTLVGWDCITFIEMCKEHLGWTYTYHQGEPCLVKDGIRLINLKEHEEEPRIVDGEEYPSIYTSFTVDGADESHPDVEELLDSFECSEATLDEANKGRKAEKNGIMRGYGFVGWPWLVGDHDHDGDAGGDAGGDGGGGE